MDLEVLAVGTELLLGYTTDTNSPQLSTSLSEIGVRVLRRCTVSDEHAEIEARVREALDRTGFVILTGGLGPTSDDVTKEAVAAVFGVPLELDNDYLARLRNSYESRGLGSMPSSNISQAEIPRGAVTLANRQGTAPGLWLEGEQGVVVMLPGVPHEMRGLLEDEVLPRIQERQALRSAESHVTRSLVLRTVRMTESALADEMKNLEAKIDPLSLAYIPTAQGVDLRITAWNMKADDAERLLASARGAIRGVLAESVYGDGAQDLAAVLLEILRTRGLSLAVAESCTGGLVAGRITDVPGSSEVFSGGVVAYDDSVKIKQLGVSPGTLDRVGAVSEEVAREMAVGAKRLFDVDAAIAVTGIAGPAGGSPDKPVGTVWLVALCGDLSASERKHFAGERGWVRQRSAQEALGLLWKMLRDV